MKIHYKDENISPKWKFILMANILNQNESSESGWNDVIKIISSSQDDISI